MTTSRAEGLHAAALGRGAPQVNVGAHVVDDLDAAAAAAGVAGLDAGLFGTSPVGLGKSGGSGCEEAGKEDVESHDGKLKNCSESGRQKIVCSTEILK